MSLAGEGEERRGCAFGTPSSLTRSRWVCRSKHEEIELVSLEEFYSEAPTEISRPDITLTEPHQQTLARLDWELEQRKRWVGAACKEPWAGLCGLPGGMGTQEGFLSAFRSAKGSSR